MSLDNGLERRSWGVYEMYTITHRREYTPECRHKIYSERPIALLTWPYPGRRRRRAAARPSRPPLARALSPLAGSSKLTRATRHPRGMESGTLLHPPRGSWAGEGLYALESSTSLERPAPLSVTPASWTSFATISLSDATSASSAATRSALGVCGWGRTVGGRQTRRVVIV